MKSLPNTEQIARVWNCVEKTEGCWLWTGWTNRHSGHASRKFWINGKPVWWLVHRLVYALEIGPIPDGMCVCHTCDVPHCVNPKHLWLGTQDDNVADRQAKGRAVHGERHPISKLSDKQARSIRERRTRGETIKALATEFGISTTVVTDIHQGKTWKHV